MSVIATNIYLILTSFSPKENTGTRSALSRISVMLAVWEQSQIDVPMLYSYLDKPKAKGKHNQNPISIPMTKVSHRFRNVRSAVPGRALRLSAAPPTTIVIACPGPFFNMFEHESLLTEQIPRARRTSR